MEVLGLIFKVFGGVVVLLILTIIVGVYLFSRWFKRKVANATRDAQTNASGGTSARVTLVPSDADWAWHHPDEAGKLESAATAAGFMPVDKFNVAEMPLVRMSAFYHPAQSASAIVYDHPKAGCWFEIVTTYPDGSTASASSGKAPTLVEIPGDLRIKNPAHTLREGWDALQAQRKPGPYLAVDGENFVTVFETNYARFMDHVLAKGEIDEKFVRESGKTFGSTAQYTDQQYAEAKRIQDEKLRDKLTGACMDNFIKASTLTAAQWEACRERALVVHERMTPAEVAELFLSWSPDFSAVPDNPKAARPAVDPRIATAQAETTQPLELFDKLNTMLPARRAFLKLGEVSTPVKAHVMLAPR